MEPPVAVTAGAALRCGTASLACLGRYTAGFAADGAGVGAAEPLTISCLRSPTMISTALSATIPACAVAVLALDNCRLTKVREK